MLHDGMIVNYEDPSSFPIRGCALLGIGTEFSIELILKSTARLANRRPKASTRYGLYLRHVTNHFAGKLAAANFLRAFHLTSEVVGHGLG